MEEVSERKIVFTPRVSFKIKATENTIIFGKNLLKDNEMELSVEQYNAVLREKPKNIKVL